MSEAISSMRSVGIREGRRSLFFPVMATVMALIAFGGFSRTFYFRALLGVEGNIGVGPLPTVVIVHGIVFTAWIGIFLIQSWLIRGRRVSIHQTLGYFGIVAAAGVVLLGVITTLNFVPRGAAAGMPLPAITSLVVGNMGSMALFALFVSLAVYWRRKPPNHKRMMYFATIFMLGPALAGGQRPIGEFLEQFIPQPTVVVLTLLVAALLWHDFAKERRILPATLLGLIAFVAMFAVFITAPGFESFQNWTATLL